MPEYTVHMIEMVSIPVTVEADDPAAAIVLAYAQSDGEVESVTDANGAQVDIPASIA